MKKQSKNEDALTRAENAIQDFIQYLDSLFFEGYAEQLATDYPQDFNAQYNQYFDNYFSN